LDQSFGKLTVTRCLFRDVRGAAIEREAGPLYSYTITGFDVSDSRFERCEAAVRVRFQVTDPDDPGSPFWLRMSADTVVDSKNTSIQVPTPGSPGSWCGLSGLRLMGSGGAGIDVNGALAVGVAGSVVTGCHDAGIRVELSQGQQSGIAAIGPS